MQQLNFWKSWPKLEQGVYRLLLLLFISSLLGLIYAHFSANDTVFPWLAYGEMTALNLSHGQFSSGIFTMGYLTENYLVKEWFSTEGIRIVPSLSYGFGLLVFVLITLLVSLVTTFQRTAYIAGMVLFILFLMMLKLEITLLFGLTNKTALIIAFFAYIPLSYFFHALKSDVKVPIRILAFSLVGGLFLGLLHSYGEVEKPLLHLVHYGVLAPYLLIFLFLVLVAQEIPRGIMVLVTNANNAYSKNSSVHFFVAMAIYIAQLVIMFLDRTSSIHLEIIPLHPYFLLVVSAVLGIWGFRSRETQYLKYLTFDKIGAWVYLLLGLLCFTTIAYFLMTANDPILYIIEQMTLYVHLAFALAFILYILANFMTPLAQNLKVHLILYKPENMPYVAYLLSAIVLTVVFVLKENMDVPYAHSLSGYYNSIGDLHSLTGEELLSKAYYKEASDLGYQNHRSNYILAYLSNQEKNDISAVYYYDVALKKRPTPQGFINLSQVYLSQDRFFEGLFILKDGLRKFPDDGRIKNNLGLLYAKVNENDSTFVALSEAEQKSYSSESAATNYIALLAEKKKEPELEEVKSRFLIPAHYSNRANLLVLYNQRATDIQLSPLPIDSLLTYPTFALLYDRIFNGLYTDEPIDTQSLAAYAAYEGNINFRERLTFLQALAHYHNDELGDAFRLMDRLAYTYDLKSGYYYNILGLWAQEQWASGLAVSFFEKAIENNYPAANVNYAIALSTDGQAERAGQIWRQLGNHPSLEKEQQQHMIRIHTTDTDTLDWSALTDYGKYSYWKYARKSQDSLRFRSLLETFDNEDLKWRCIIEIVHKKIEANQSESALAYWGLIPNRAYDTTDSRLLQDLFLMKMEMLVLAGQWEALKRELEYARENAVKLPISNDLHYKARLAVHENDTAAANEYYDKLAKKNPFYEQGIIAAANHIHQQNPLEAYQVLLKATETNPNTVSLLEAYVIQCARLGFDTYAQHILEELKLSLIEEEYERFHDNYHRILMENEGEETEEM